MTAYEQTSSKTIGENLESLRYMNHLSVLQLADGSGLSKSSLYLWERGTRKPRENTLEILASFYHMPVEDLYLEPFDFGEVLMEAFTGKASDKQIYRCNPMR